MFLSESVSCPSFLVNEKELPVKTEAPSKNAVEIKSINAKDIDPYTLLELAEVVEDMWAWAWIKEFVQCTQCDKIFSKKDIYGDIPEWIYKKTVANIMRIMWQKNIPCPCCANETQFMYEPKKYIDIMCDKYKNSIDAFLTIVRNQEGEIVWFSEGYVDTVDQLFSRRDLWDHYGDIDISLVKESIEDILWYNPPFVFLISAIWLLESYVNPYTLISMLNIFTKDIPDKYDYTPWLMELEKWHILYAVSETLWAKKSWISYTRDSDIIKNWYSSDLLVFKNPIWSWKENFWWWMLRFLRKRKNIKPESQVNHTQDTRIAEAELV